MENMNMKKIGRQMSLLMGSALSFFLSLAGNLSSGHFTIIGFILSLIISFLIGLALGVIVPVKPLSDKITGKLGMQSGKLSTMAVEALISDLVYTPVITLGMVFLAYRMAVSHGASQEFLPMFLGSLVRSLILGYVLIFIFTPLFLKFLFKKNGISGPSERPEK